MDKQNTENFRIGPTTQQGGTQTIQQSIYVAHNNPCGANLLIFEEMGLTKIRYIDLKNYLNNILSSNEMQYYFEQIRIDGTYYMTNPNDEQKKNRYLNTIKEWGKAGIHNLPIPVDFYPGYLLRFSVYDLSGATIWDSFFPRLEVTSYEESTGLYYRNNLRLLPSNPLHYEGTPLYKLCNTPNMIAYLDTTYPIVYDATFSDYTVNQMSTPESIMAVSSLLIDSANTRTFGIPRYGFSSRTTQHLDSGLGYFCATVINIYSIPYDEYKPTLIETIVARLSIEENTLFTTKTKNPTHTDTKDKTFRFLE